MNKATMEQIIATIHKWECSSSPTLGDCEKLAEAIVALLDTQPSVPVEKLKALKNSVWDAKNFDPLTQVLPIHLIENLIAEHDSKGGA